jgi:hypothetical protein
VDKSLIIALTAALQARTNPYFTFRKPKFVKHKLNASVLAHPSTAIETMAAQDEERIIPHAEPVEASEMIVASILIHFPSKFSFHISHALCHEDLVIPCFCDIDSH